MKKYQSSYSGAAGNTDGEGIMPILYFFAIIAMIIAMIIAYPFVWTFRFIKNNP